MAEIKTASTAKPAFKDVVIAKRSRLIFFVLNLALVIPFIVKNYSHWGLGGAFLILLLSFYQTIVKPYEATSAARDVPMLLFFNICVFLVMSYQPLIDNFQIKNLLSLLKSLDKECIILLVVGLALGLFVPRVPHMAWLRYIGKTAVGAALILQIWGGGKVFKPEFVPGGTTMLAFYLLFAIVWSVLCIISCYTHHEAFKRNNQLSNWLLIFLLLFSTTENTLAQAFIPKIDDFLRTMPTQALAWWKVILGAVILVGCAVAAYDYQNDTIGEDALLLCFVASALVILRVLMANYFAFCWVIFAIFLFSCVKCLKNELRQKQTLRLSNLIYVAVQFAVTLVSVWLIKAGLWISLVVAAVYTLIFYATANRGLSEKHRLCHWLTLLSVPAVFAIAYIWPMRFSRDAIVLVALSFTVLAGAMVILHWPHPDKVSVPKGFKIALCAMLALLCVIAMSRFGSKVTVEFDSTQDIATVEINPKGKNNSVQSVEYQWRNAKGDPIETSTMDVSGASLPVLGEVLTITVTDGQGVVTTKTEWFPDWLLTE